MKSEKQLYQWDVNQYLTELQPTAKYIDYPMGNEVIRIKTDGTRCRIPDEFLQDAGFKTCYERYSDGTYKAYSFNVQSSPKPPDYVYTAEERTTFEALVEKADAAIEEIKRRADSGEFTPVKGVDYFTETEKNELMESVSDGAIGEFRKVVDTATTEYNDNHNLKLAKYNANASEKLTTYDTNAEQHTMDYNRNAEVKLEAYNQNHTEKVAEYNQNAAALQTEVDRLRGECDTLAAENRKQETRIDALIKLNKGQTYDILPEAGEAASRTAPSGAKYVSVDKVGGKSVVEDGKIVSSTTAAVELEGKNLWDDSDLAFTKVLTSAGFVYSSGVWQIDSVLSATIGIDKVPPNATFAYDIKCAVGCNARMELISGTTHYRGTNLDSTGQWTHHVILIPEGTVIDKIAIDYNSREFCEIKNIQLERGTTETAYSPHTKQSITTDFPELHSAGIAHDEIDMDSGAIRRNVGTVDLGSLSWSYSDKYEWWESNSMIGQIVAPAGSSLAANAICNRFEIVKQNDNYIKPGVSVWTSGKISVKSDEIKSAEDLSGVTLYFEKVTPTTEQVTIPEALQEWLPVESGGTVTFRNADESKQLAVPNGVSWVRKLDEVE